MSVSLHSGRCWVTVLSWLRPTSTSAQNTLEVIEVGEQVYRQVACLSGARFTVALFICFRASFPPCPTCFIFLSFARLKLQPSHHKQHLTAEREP